MERHTLDEVLILINNLSKMVELAPVGRRPSEDEISEAEKALGFELPPSYVRFYQTVQWHMGHDLCSVVPLFKGQWSFVRSNNLLRNGHEVKYPLPDFLVVFDMTFAIDGEFSCFDTRFKDEHGEYPIVYWDSDEISYMAEHDSETGELIEIDELERIGPDFPTYLYRHISDIISSQEKGKKSKQLHSVNWDRLKKQKFLKAKGYPLKIIK